MPITDIGILALKRTVGYYSLMPPECQTATPIEMAAVGLQTHFALAGTKEYQSACRMHLATHSVALRVS